eukprot:349615-Chlamydomonas_euryale.AAC.6
MKRSENKKAETIHQHRPSLPMGCLLAALPQGPIGTTLHTAAGAPHMVAFTLKTQLVRFLLNMVCFRLPQPPDLGLRFQSARVPACWPLPTPFLAPVPLLTHELGMPDGTAPDR